jgi:hypothetical protein
MKRYKTAVIFTGSGGTISQEVAIVDQLVKSGKLTLNEHDTFLAASGSGAVNLLAINACFREEKPCSWDNFYKETFLKTIADEETFIKVDPIHWITLPQRKKINELINEAEFSTISGLPFDSAILATSMNENKSIWLKSTSRKERDLNLTDIIMASSAIPVLFPTQQLNVVDNGFSTKFIGAYYEGSMPGLFHKFKKQLKKITLEHGSFEQIFIISPKRLFDYSKFLNHDLSMMLPQEKFQFKQFLNQISLHGFLAFLIKLQKANSKKSLSKSIMVSIPEMEDNFGLLDYSDQICKYEVVTNWFNQNPNRLTVDISTYINEIAFIPSFSENYYSKQGNNY